MSYGEGPWRIEVSITHLPSGKSWMQSSELRARRTVTGRDKVFGRFKTLLLGLGMSWLKFYGEAS